MKKKIPRRAKKKKGFNLVKELMQKFAIVPCYNIVEFWRSYPGYLIDNTLIFLDYKNKTINNKDLLMLERKDFNENSYNSKLP